MLGAVKLPPGGLPALARLHTVSFYLPAERNWGELAVGIPAGGVCSAVCGLGRE